MTDDPFARARHVQAAERHVANLVWMIERLENSEPPNPGAAAKAREVLATLKQSLELARDHLRRERHDLGLKP